MRAFTLAGTGELTLAPSIQISYGRSMTQSQATRTGSLTIQPDSRTTHGVK